MVRAYLNVRATGGAVFFPMRGENTRERWSPFKGEGDGGCSKRKKRKCRIKYRIKYRIKCRIKLKADG